MTLLERCRRDRDFLLGECRRLLGVSDDLVPADLLDEVVEEIVDFCLVERVLAVGQMGEVDFDNRLLIVSSALASCVRPNTDLPGVRNSTKAHELGHIRLHEAELRSVGCRDLPSDHPDYQRREREADLYAATFLVPEEMLLSRPEMQELLALHREGRSLPSEQLWDLVLRLAAFFKVSGSLMRRLLVSDLGLLSMAEAGRELSVKGVAGGRMALKSSVPACLIELTRLQPGSPAQLGP